MKNNQYFKKYLFIFITVITIFSLMFITINLIEYNKYKQNFNYKINAIIKEINEKYPDIEKETLLEILKSTKNQESIFSEYGYDLNQDTYIYQNDLYNHTFNSIKITLLIIMFITLIYLFIKYNYTYNLEINKIIKCIENINHKNYELNIDELSEDKLSILKQEIYKTTIMLKENAENSHKDKINLKNSLQDISHQLKTPLTSINILLDNILDDTNMNNETRQNFIKQIKREITNITFLVESILKLSKFDANTITFTKEEVSIKKIIQETQKNVANLCDLKNIAIEVTNKCQNKINCDYRWQVEALTNILKNAVEYSYPESKILILCEDNNIYTQIKIIDNGKGMDPEDAKNIFKRFYKGKNANQDSVGIGLSLSKAIIEKDNGIINIETKKDYGTTFIIKYFFK